MSSLGFTTTPEQRIGPDPPFTDPSIQANLFFRVLLGVVSVAVTYVPANLLWWNGELAATVFCVVNIILNTINVINSVIWSDNDVANWYAGYGWCDLQTYLVYALETVYHICLFEIMRGLANKVALRRASSLTPSERRRKRIRSSFLLFIIPLLQVILTYFVIIQRYNISTLAGCTVWYDSDWIVLIFFILPSPIFAFGAAFMAGLAFVRYRRLEKVARESLRSYDSVRSARQQRVRQKLYFMSLAILLVVLPVVAVLFAVNLMDGWPWTTPYDYNSLHFGPGPYNMYAITFTTSDIMSFGDLTINYIPVLSSVAIFIAFGTTAEAINQYRKFLLAIGLGKLFPNLHIEYQQSPSGSGSRSWFRTITRPLLGRNATGTSNSQFRKDSILPTSEHISLPSQTGTSSTNFQDDCITPLDAVAVGSDYFSQTSTDNHSNPWPDLSTDEMDRVHHRQQTHAQRVSMRSPWMTFRFAPAAMPIKLSPLLSSLRKRQDDKQHQQLNDPTQSNPVSLGAMNAAVGGPSVVVPSVDTHVWSDDRGVSSPSASAPTHHGDDHHPGRVVRVKISIDSSSMEGSTK
ncbi:pheromone A receptor-domain-containing protein [Bombardia bombarda]|uniref:Pheromone A receptor-domain-containing protein n=1 Tax=Bombardia bombarda TaxID=252184 RepID=A0AA40C1R1_9PEZI|nr:pheromone A receptor-domain-containing protein [Bombardia bombarda]